MSGLEQILQEILADTQLNIQNLLEEAKAESENILKAAQEKSGEESLSILKEGEKQAQAYLDRSRSALQMEERKAMLFAKQQKISQVMREALRTLKELPDDQYFEMIYALAAKYAQNKPGEIAFSQRDLNRLPAGFEQKLSAKLAPEAVLQVHDAPCDIDGGFLLLYGGVEENCSFPALFEEKKEQMQDELHALLFPQGA